LYVLLFLGIRTQHNNEKKTRQKQQKKEKKEKKKIVKKEKKEEAPLLRTTAARAAGTLRVPLLAMPSGDGVANLRRVQRGWRRVPATLLQNVERRLCVAADYCSPVPFDEVSLILLAIILLLLLLVTAFFQL